MFKIWTLSSRLSHIGFLSGWCGYICLLMAVDAMVLIQTIIEILYCLPPRRISPRRPGNHNKHNDHQNITNVPVLCHNNSDNSDHCDLFPELTGFRNHFISNFILAHINMYSSRHKYGDIHDILSQKHVDYLAVSETKLDCCFPCAQFAAQDFTIHRQDLTYSSGSLGAVSIRKTVLPGMAIPMLKIRRPNGRLILTWKSPYVDKTVFILRRGPAG